MHTLHYFGNNSRIKGSVRQSLFGVLVYVNCTKYVMSLPYRSTDYGVSFVNIERQLDNSPLLVLWHTFFVSPVNKNMVIHIE